MDKQTENTNFYHLWGISQQALACLRRARELFLQSNDATSLEERLRLQEEALQLQRQALPLLEESDRLLRSQVAEEKAKIAAQRAEQKGEEELAPQD